MIETSNGLRCIHPHWQYYSRSTAPARQRKIKANRRLKKNKPVHIWRHTTATGPVQNPTTFSHTDCCKLPEETSGNKTTLVEREKNKQRQQRQLCHETQWHTNPTCVGYLQVHTCNVPSEGKTIAAFRRHAAGFQQASVA